MFHRSSAPRKPLLAALLAMLVLLAAPSHPARADQAGLELLMVEQAHCEWCEAWNQEIGAVYSRTEEGRRAPLRRQDLFADWPAGIEITGQVHFTPTFILLRDGREIGRIEGYPGEHFFWPLLAQLLNRTPRNGAPSTGDGS